ncbi:MAG: BrnT family toxin [Rhodocyclaceae bacterium]|nr:BrnT family toxin [Rhodocyclaceae bacterium]
MTDRECIDIANTPARMKGMDIYFELNGMTFIWNAKKAAVNSSKHDGITFERAATVFFDPFFRLVDVTRGDEPRDAVIGFDALSHLLFVVHVELDGEAIRIISARRATNEEHKHYDL